MSGKPMDPVRLAAVADYPGWWWRVLDGGGEEPAFVHMSGDGVLRWRRPDGMRGYGLVGEARWAGRCTKALDAEAAIEVPT